MMRSEIALWPHPAHSVVLPPRYGGTSRPIRLILVVCIYHLPAGGLRSLGPQALFPSSGQCRRYSRARRGTLLLTFLNQDLVRDRPRVDRKSIEVKDAPELRDLRR